MPSPCDPEILRYNRLLMRAGQVREEKLVSTVLGSSPHVDTLVGNCILRQTLRDKVGDMRSEPSFKQEKYLMMLADDVVGPNSELLGSKAGVTELMASRYDTASRESLETDILSWLDKGALCNDELVQLSDKRASELQTEQTNAQTSSTTVEQHTDDMARLTYQAAKTGTQLIDYAKEQAIKLTYMPVTVPKKCQTTISMGEPPDEQQSYSADDQSSEMQFQSNLSSNYFREGRNKRQLGLLSKMDCIEVRNRENQAMLHSEIHLRDELVKRIQSEMRIITTGIGFTEDWDKPIDERFPEFDVKKLMQDMRRELREQASGDRDVIKEQKQQIIDLQSCLEALKLGLKNETAKLEEQLEEATGRKEELAEELLDRDEALRTLRSKIAKREGQLAVCHEAGQKSEEARAELMIAVDALREANMILEERAKLLITPEELQETVERHREKLMTFKRMKEQEQKKMETLLQEASSGMAVEKSLKEEVSEQLAELKVKYQRAVERCNSDAITVLGTIDVVRQACCHDGDTECRESIWGYTTALLTYLAMPQQHVTDAKVTKEAQHLLSIELCPPMNKLQMRVEEMEKEVEWLKECVGKAKQECTAARANSASEITEHKQREASIGKYLVSFHTCLQEAMLCRTPGEVLAKEERLGGISDLVPEAVNAHWDDATAHLVGAYKIAIKSKARELAYERLAKQTAGNKQPQGSQRSVREVTMSIGQLRQGCIAFKNKLVAPLVDELYAAASEEEKAKIDVLMAKENVLRLQSVTTTLNKCRAAVTLKILKERDAVHHAKLLSEYQEAVGATDADKVEIVNLKMQEAHQVSRTKELESVSRMAQAAKREANISGDRLHNLVEAMCVLSELAAMRTTREAGLMNERLQTQEQFREEMELLREDMRQLRRDLGTSQRRVAAQHSTIEELEETITRLRTQEQTHKPANAAFISRSLTEAPTPLKTKRALTVQPVQPMPIQFMQPVRPVLITEIQQTEEALFVPLPRVALHAHTTTSTTPVAVKDVRSALTQTVDDTLPANLTMPTRKPAGKTTRGGRKVVSDLDGALVVARPASAQPTVSKVHLALDMPESPKRSEAGWDPLWEIDDSHIVVPFSRFPSGASVQVVLKDSRLFTYAMVVGVTDGYLQLRLPSSPEPEAVQDVASRARALVPYATTPRLKALPLRQEIEKYSTEVEVYTGVDSVRPRPQSPLAQHKVSSRLPVSGKGASLPKIMFPPQLAAPYCEESECDSVAEIVLNNRRGKERPTLRDVFRSTAEMYSRLDLIQDVLDQNIVLHGTPQSTVLCAVFPAAALAAVVAAWTTVPYDYGVRYSGLTFKEGNPFWRFVAD